MGKQNPRKYSSQDRQNQEERQKPEKKACFIRQKLQGYLEDFQKHFVLVPADKVSNNVLIVCKNIT